MSLGKQAAQGAFWNYSAFLVSKGVLALATFILARILAPDQFGLMSMALLVITAFDVLRDFGIGSALIYRQKDGQAAANVAFLLSTGLGVILFVANLLLAPVFVQFFKTDTPEQADMLATMIRVLGLSILFVSFGTTQDSLLKKEINYRRRMIPEVARTTVKGALQVGLALTGWGVWSLVIGQVAGDAAAMVLLWVGSRWRPTFDIERRLFRPMLSYGFQIMLIGGLGWLVSDADYLIIGRLLGDTPLGIYTIAFRIPELLLTNLAQAVSNVAFPVTARLQGDREALRDAYLAMQHYMLVILAPLGFGLYAVTPALMHVLFGAKWNAAIPVMQILSLYMVIGGINHWPGVIYKAVGRPEILTILAVIKLALLAPTLWWGATNFGIEGVAWGQLVVRCFTGVLDMSVVAWFVHITVLSNLRIIWPPLASSVIMAAAVQGVFLLLDPAAQSLMVLALAVAVGAAIYLAMIWLLDRAAVTTMLNLVRSLLMRRRPAPAAEA